MDLKRLKRYFRQELVDFLYLSTLTIFTTRVISRAKLISFGVAPPILVPLSPFWTADALKAKGLVANQPLKATQSVGQIHQVHPVGGELLLQAATSHRDLGKVTQTPIGGFVGKPLS